jgi:hypothetical protein
MMDDSALIDYTCVKCYADHSYLPDHSCDERRCIVDSACKGRLIKTSSLTMDQREAKVLKEKQIEQDIIKERRW